MELYDYQLEAKSCVHKAWLTHNKVLLEMATGTGKTIVFSHITKDVTVDDNRTLVLADRDELIDQAIKKLLRSVGIVADKDKAQDFASLDARVVVGSVQTMSRTNRMERFPPNHFTHIIVDECDKCLCDTFQKILSYFKSAKVLGVTATPDRGDKRELGEYFESIAYRYDIGRGVREKRLARPMVQTLPIKIDLSKVKVVAGDFDDRSVASALEPYLDKIADELVRICKDRKTLIFLPLIDTSKKMLAKLIERGANAREVNHKSADREQTVAWFDTAPKGSFLCNAMLLGRGVDIPSIDCVCILRATKVRSMYAQMIGRGTRVCAGKDGLLILDFLWLSEKHQLCRPSYLVSNKDTLSKRTAELIEQQDGMVDLIDATNDAESTATDEREESLRRELNRQKHKRAGMVDPLQYLVSVKVEYTPDVDDLRSFRAPSDRQLELIAGFGVDVGDIESYAHAGIVLDQLMSRARMNLATPKQIRKLESYGFNNVGTWTSVQASMMMSRIALNKWRVPWNVRANEYKP